MQVGTRSLPYTTFSSEGMIPDLTPGIAALARKGHGRTL